jgi:hypothetical protein
VHFPKEDAPDARSQNISTVVSHTLPRANVAASSSQKEA